MVKKLFTENMANLDVEFFKLIDQKKKKTHC